MGCWKLLLIYWQSLTLHRARGSGHSRWAKKLYLPMIPEVRTSTKVVENGLEKTNYNLLDMKCSNRTDSNVSKKNHLDKTFPSWENSPMR